MLYLNFSDTSIEAVQTGKDVLGREKFKAASRKELPEGVITNGLVTDSAKLLSALSELLLAGFPQPIKDTDAALTTSDQQVVTERLVIDSVATEDGRTQAIISGIKKILPYDPVELENFYKTVQKNGDSEEILYTAMSKTGILHITEFFKLTGLKLDFLTSRSYGLFEVLKPIISKERRILFCEIDRKIVEYYLVDQYGPLRTVSKRLGTKSLVTETKNYISELEGENKAPAMIILGGIGSIELNTEEISEATGKIVTKMGLLYDDLEKVHKFNLTTGGIPPLFFLQSLGLMLLTRSKSPPNFALDKMPPGNYQAPPETRRTEIHHENKTVTKINENSGEISQPEVPENDLRIIPEEIMSAEDSGSRKIFSGRIWLFILFVIIGIGIVLGLFSVLGKSHSFSLSMMAKPTVTPAPTSAPTVTPTPTIDPSLKRSDLKLAVQNGTDKTGYAKSIADYLESRGYKNIAKSNADNTDYTQTLIKIKNSKKNYLPLLVSDLKDKVSTANTSSLDESEADDAVIILGQN